MKQIKNKLELLVLVWIVLVLIHFLFYFGSSDLLFLLSPLFGLLLFLVGFILLIILIFNIFSSKIRRALKLILTSAIIITVYLGWFTNYGTLFGLYSHLWRNESDYLKQIQLVENHATRDQLSENIIVDNGPPIRVAFSLGGILDNWSGIIYDPSGEVMKINEDQEFVEVETLFGGRLLSASHLWGNWYYCSFT